jgi:hypothetical protein
VPTGSLRRSTRSHSHRANHSPRPRTAKRPVGRSSSCLLAQAATDDDVGSGRAMIDTQIVAAVSHELRPRPRFSRFTLRGGRRSLPRQGRGPSCPSEPVPPACPFSRSRAWALRSSICGWCHAVEACRTAAPAAAKIRLRRGQMRITGHQLHDLGPTRGDHDTLHGQPIQTQQTRRVIATVNGPWVSSRCSRHSEDQAITGHLRSGAPNQVVRSRPESL